MEAIYFMFILWYIATTPNSNPNSLALFFCVAGLFGICMVHAIEKCLMNIFHIDDDIEDVEEDVYGDDFKNEKK